jgi:predicted amidohydrolase YtcJ
MVLLDADPLRATGEDLKRIKVNLTMTGGRITYDSTAKTH